VQAGRAIDTLLADGLMIMTDPDRYALPR
jgi:hypothetical protein